MVECMKRGQISNSRSLLRAVRAAVAGGWLRLCAVAEPPAAAVAAFNSYVGAVEARLAQQHRSRGGVSGSGGCGAGCGGAS